MFIDQPRATERTMTSDNQSFAGAIGLFGAGRPLDLTRDKAHECPAEDAHDQHRSHGGGQHGGHHVRHHHDQDGIDERMDVEIDITGALREAEGDEVAIKIVAVGVDGTQVPADAIEVQAVELVVE